MDFLIENKYDYLIQNICIYCMNVDKYSHFRKKCNKVKGVYDETSQVIKFIEDMKSNKIIEFSTVKMISYLDYKDIYYERHEKVCEFYGDMTKEKYNEYSKKIEEYILSKEEKEFKNITKNELIESFKTFDLSKDLDNIESIIRPIKEYTRNTFHYHINNWLRIFKTGVYEIMAYFTARLMYALNSYVIKANSYFNKEVFLFRGTSATYITLLPYERLIGKIIIISLFTSTTEDEEIALEFSDRENAEKNYKAKKKFSVIYKIKNYANNNNCIPCGIDIQGVSEYDDEKEILIQPFSFYFVKNVKFNYQKYTVDIDLELIPKKEILEEKIRKGKKNIYDKKTKLMIIDEKSKK